MTPKEDQKQPCPHCNGKGKHDEVNKETVFFKGHPVKFIDVCLACKGTGYVLPEYWK